MKIGEEMRTNLKEDLKAVGVTRSVLVAGMIAGGLSGLAQWLILYTPWS